MEQSTNDNNIQEAGTETNNLFPVFLKLETLRLLIVGGGNVALEKLSTVLQNSPATKIHLVAITVTDEIRKLQPQYTSLVIDQRPFDIADLESADVVIVAVNDIPLSERIMHAARARSLLVNVADKPALCDFYLGSIVKKGNLKIAISTNGKSPTIAKRLKEVIGGLIPDEMEELLQNMQTVRNGMQGDFDEKVRQLNDLTKVLIAKKINLEPVEPRKEGTWQNVVKWSIFAFLFMLVGHGLFLLLPPGYIWEGVRSIPSLVDNKTFMLMLLTGFLAQMVDGSLGMGYGTISTTFLLAIGVSPAVVSSRVHSARVFSSGVSGYSHHRFGNINKKLFRALVVPGAIGAVIGATLAFYGQQYSNYVRLPLSIYTAYLGYYIVRKAFSKHNLASKVTQAGWLASAGGFMDAFAGGGWGALVTSTLISKRRSPRYVIGSVCLAEFFVVFASSVTFFIFLKHIPLLEVAGLIIGGLIAAPIAARLVGKLPMKSMLIAVGSMVVLTSCWTFIKVAMQLLK